MMKLTKRKGFNFFRSYFDVFNELQTDEDKVAFITALLDRQFLGVKPNGLKGMAKFAYISQTNSIDSQVKGYEDKTKTKLAPIITKNNTPSVGGCQGGSDTPTLQEKEKEKEKEKVEVEDKKEKKEKKFVFRKSLIELGFDEKLVHDWLVVRKNKKASNTKTAFNTIKNEVEQTNIDLNKILSMHVVRSWAGFKVKWYENETISINKNQVNGTKVTFETNR